jgi:hypothetical protein
MRLLFTTRNNPYADYYSSWATDILFVNQLGTTDQCAELAADLLGYPVATVRRFLSACCASDVAGVYMWALGTVGELREKLRFDKAHRIPDSYVVAKLGKSDDFYDRSGSLMYEFKKLGISMELYLFTCVDPERVFKAEGALKQWFKERDEALEVGRKFEGFTELVAFAPGTKEKTAIKSQFRVLSLEFGGATNQQIKDMQAQQDKERTEWKASERVLRVEKKAAEEMLRKEEDKCAVLAENIALLKQLYEAQRARV